MAALSFSTLLDPPFYGLMVNAALIEVKRLIFLSPRGLAGTLDRNIKQCRQRPQFSSNDQRSIAAGSLQAAPRGIAHGIFAARAA